MNKSKLLIHNARIINEGETFLGSLLVEDAFIAEILRGNHTLSELPPEVVDGAEVIEAEGLLLMPGVIDDQVHFREPGLTHKATIESESRASVAGGVTSFLDMPNTKPATTDYDALMWKRERAQSTSWANYGFYLGGTNDNANDVFRVNPKLFAGYKLFLGSSTGNMLVDSPKALDQFFAESPKVIAIHSESEPIIQANRQKFISEYGEDPPIACHPLIRSDEACYRCTCEALERATKYGTRLHVLHLSTAREAALFHSSTPFAEKLITAEACVHHLWFSDADYAERGALIKWNPAIKTLEDREALKKALRDDDIDIIATDHAPHLLSEKQGGALKATGGGPLIQHALLVVLELVRRGELSLPAMAAKMCHNPATRFGIHGRGFLRKGYFADLTLIDPATPTSVLRDATLLSLCGWSPFEGITFSSSIFATIVNGKVAYYKGTLQARPPVEALIFE